MYASCDCYVSSCETNRGSIERWVCKGTMHIDSWPTEKETNTLGGYKIEEFKLDEIEDKQLGTVHRRDWNPELFRRIEEKLLKHMQKRGLPDDDREPINYFFGYM